LEGKTPFLNISEYSQKRQTLTYTDTDVPFASNVTARNAQLDKTTIFTGKLYNTDESGEKTGEPIWTQDFESTLENPLTHITVPGELLTQVGTYALEITTTYYGGEIIGQQTPANENLSATAYLTVKQSPAVVKLNKLDSYYVTNDSIPEIGYTVTPETSQVEYTIQKSGEDVSARMPVSGGVIPFSADTPATLKEAYTITVYARNNEAEDWSVDSMLLTVYNPDILHQIVSDVTAGEIGGTTGGTGNNIDGTTIEMDNHGKISNYGVTGDRYQLSFDDFTALRTDMSLQKIVSVNYGEATYGLLSDRMQWESSDSSLVNVNYKQGGIYSDVRYYGYTSYTPATDFLLVGHDDTEEGEKVTITATHANTGIESSFDVTTKTLKDQLYVFQFKPAVKTDVIYTNGKCEKRTLSSNDKGELAVYEPDGIFEPVMVKSEFDGRTYVGTLFPKDLESGERDVASLQLY
ncbi:MAG: hypothetical protein VZR73_15840, partial [Acutalibacteraceae bacterium]|nr:hypothetical protein [Acutalibacteraceae bacterium]